MGDESFVAKQFLNIFQGRQDAYGADDGRAVYAPVNEETIVRHLSGIEPIGIYPIRFHNNPIPEGRTDQEQMRDMRVRWGCCDIDTGDWNEAYRLATTLRAMELQPWIERSRSKGWHVWVFTPKSVAAYEMRRALKVAYSAIDLPAREANPKSELLRPNQLGNYVRAPYPGALTNDHQTRQVMMVAWSESNDGTAIPLDDFLAHDHHSDPKKIEYWASKWHEPQRAVIDVVPSEEVEALIARLPRPMKTLFEKGPRIHEGKPKPDTSQGLAALAHNLAALGWSAGDVYAIVAAADQRWGKYFLRNNTEQYIEDIVRRAFS